MSIRAMNWAWEQADLPSSEKLLLMALADTADDDGICWPGQRYLAEKCCCADRTIRRLLVKLHDRDLIRREERSRENGSRTSDRIALTLQDPPDKMSGAPRTRVSAPPGHGCPPQNHQGNQSLLEGEDDVGNLSKLLADLIEKNGAKRPTIGKRWRDAERLMLTADGRDREEAERVLRWSQADDFWRANILSMTKFRAKYDTLKLQAERTGQRPKGGKHFEMERSDAETPYPF